MVNVKKQDIDKYNCLLCNKCISKDHYFSNKHINNFGNNISVRSKDSIKKKFIDLIFDFHIIDKNVLYTDLYFKDYLKKMIVKNCGEDKNYKIIFHKFNQALIKNDSLEYWVEKYILQNISDIDDIESLKLKNNTNNLEAINIGVESDVPNYNSEDNLEQLNILAIDKNYDSSIRAIQHSRLIVKISE